MCIKTIFNKIFPGIEDISEIVPHLVPEERVNDLPMHISYVEDAMAAVTNYKFRRK